jgi:hypothetical protein
MKIKFQYNPSLSVFPVSVDTLQKGNFSEFFPVLRFQFWLWHMTQTEAQPISTSPPGYRVCYMGKIHSTPQVRHAVHPDVRSIPLLSLPRKWYSSWPRKATRHVSGPYWVAAKTRLAQIKRSSWRRQRQMCSSARWGPRRSWPRNRWQRLG